MPASLHSPLSGGTPMGGFPALEPVPRSLLHLAGQVRYLPEYEYRSVRSASDEIGVSMAVTVAIQERSRLLREGLALILDPEPEISLVGTVVGGEALFALCEKTTPSVVLFEIDVREWDPCRLAYRLQQAWPSMSFLGLYRHDGEATARARRCGLRRLVSLQADASELLAELTAPPHRGPPSSGRWLRPHPPLASSLPARSRSCSSSGQDALRGRSETI